VGTRDRDRTWVKVGSFGLAILLGLSNFPEAFWSTRKNMTVEHNGTKRDVIKDIDLYLYLIIKAVMFPSSTNFFEPFFPPNKSHITSNATGL
jgi:hypothetical protein